MEAKEWSSYLLTLFELAFVAGASYFARLTSFTMSVKSPHAVAEVGSVAARV